MIRNLLTALSLMLAAGPAAAIDLADMTAEERAAFGAAVREYLLENPQVIFEAVAVHEERQAAAQAAADIDLIARNAPEIFFDGRSWAGGNPDGDVTLVEFVDYRCGYCKKAYEEVLELVETDGMIRFVLKEFPILGEQSTLAARFAIAVRNTEGADAYEKVHDELMRFRGTVGMKALERLAERLGFDFAVIRPAMDAPEVDLELGRNYALARELNINGTPGFVLQTEILRGYAPLDVMRGIVARVRG